MNMSAATKAYANVAMESGVQGANSIKLISMLYQGAIQAIGNAKICIQKNDVPAKGKAIAHAIRIIAEGLRASLDKNVGGQLAYDLDALYEYMCVRLANANLNNDTAMLDEVSRLLTEPKGAWDSIQPGAAPMPIQPVPAATQKQAPLVYGRG